MRSGPRQRDGTHPDADLIYDASLTVTPPSEAIRRQMTLRITDDRVEIASGQNIAAVPGNLAHLLTELVHQSGWGWQGVFADWRSEEHTSELQSLMRISYAVFCLKKKKQY